VLIAAKAIIIHKLGINHLDSEEFSDGAKYMEKSLKLFESISDGLRLRYINTM
jgi:hypothetical protein